MSQACFVDGDELASGPHPLADGEAEFAGDEWRRSILGQIIERGTILAPYLKQVAEAFGRHERRPRPPPLEEGISCHRRAVRQTGDRNRLEPRCGKRREYAHRLIAGSRKDLCRYERTVCEGDKVSESPAHINADPRRSGQPDAPLKTVTMSVYKWYIRGASQNSRGIGSFVRADRRRRRVEMPRKAPLLMERAYNEIKRRIITLELAPGQRIDDYELSLEHPFSRTPIREAIFRLAAEGLIDMPTKAGFIVRPIDLIDITHLFEAHLVLAKAVARLAAKRVTPPEIEQMAGVAEEIRSAIERRDYLAITSSNAQLHRLEAAAAHNRHLQSMADTIHDQGQRLAYLCFGGAGGDRSTNLDEHFRKVCAHHDAMLAALGAHDTDAAERIAIEHVQLFRERAQAFVDSGALRGFALSDAELAAVSFEQASRSRLLS